MIKIEIIGIRWWFLITIITLMLMWLYLRVIIKRVKHRTKNPVKKVYVK